LAAAAAAAAVVAAVIAIDFREYLLRAAVAWPRRLFCCSLRPPEIEANLAAMPFD
jgi:hypothetical protein